MRPTWGRNGSRNAPGAGSMAAEVRKRAGIRVETDGGERMGAVSHAPGIQKLSEELDSVPGARLSVRC